MSPATQARDPETQAVHKDHMDQVAVYLWDQLPMGLNALLEAKYTHGLFLFLQGNYRIAITWSISKGWHLGSTHSVSSSGPCHYRNHRCSTSTGTRWSPHFTHLWHTWSNLHSRHMGCLKLNIRPTFIKTKPLILCLSCTRPGIIWHHASTLDIQFHVVCWLPLTRHFYLCFSLTEPILFSLPQLYTVSLCLYLINPTLRIQTVPFLYKLPIFLSQPINPIHNRHFFLLQSLLLQARNL